MLRCKLVVCLLVLILLRTTGSPVAAQTAQTVPYRQIVHLKIPQLLGIAWKPDGTQLAVVSYPSILLWNMATQTLSTLVADAQVSDISWSPDGSEIAAVQGGDDESLFIWNASTGNLVRRMTRAEPYKAYLYHAAWSPDGQKIASDGTGRYLLIWDLSGDGKVYPLQGNDGRFGTPYWNADSRQVASSETDGIHIWNLATAQHPLIIPNLGIADWNPIDSKLLATGENGQAYIWDLTTDRPLLRFDHGVSVLSARWNFNSSLVATGALDGTLKIWNAQSGALLTTIQQTSAFITALAWHPNRNLLASTSYDDNVIIWQVDIG
jgi:WD40 repeat protein